MWGTILQDAYRKEDAASLRDALEELIGPNSGSGFATSGVYVFWNFETREPLYVGIAGDLSERFAQHNGLRGCPVHGCKREQISQYFAIEGEVLGYSVLTLSSLSQQSTSRQRLVLDLQEPELIELNEALSQDVVDELRALEGRLIALHQQQFGTLPRWNVSPGRIPRKTPDADDGTLALVVGLLDCLLQARIPIRQLAQDAEAMMLEEHLHGTRITDVRMSVQGFDNESFRERVACNPAVPSIRDELLESGYLDRHNPLVA